MDMAKLLEELHTAVAEDLLVKIQSGEATAADLSVARAFLKDNGVDSVAFADSPIANIAAALPFHSPDEPVENIA
jgi:hypothetical protein